MLLRNEVYPRPRRHSRRWGRTTFGLVIAICAVQSGALLGTPAVPSYAAVPSFHTSLDPDAVRESMQYIIDTYKVSPAEALRRLELQNDAQKLDALLTAERPETYGGMQMDQDGGGRLILQMTRPTDAQRYITALPDRAHVKVRQVKYSLDRLERTRQELARNIDESADSTFLTAIDEPNNSVVLWERDWVAEAKASGTWTEQSGSRAPMVASADQNRHAAANEHAIADSAIAATAIPVERRVLHQPNPLYSPYQDWGFCHPLYCKAVYGGMRGGLRLNIKRDDGSWGGCTAGFNARSGGGSVNGWAWVLTAGHCVVGKTNYTWVHHNGYNILNQHGSAGGYLMERNAYPYDFAFLSYIDGTQSGTWLENQSGHNKVMKYCRNGGQDSDSDTPCGTQAVTDTEYLTGYHTLSEIKKDWVVCASGTASSTKNYPESYFTAHNDLDNADYYVGTRCGKVLSTDVGINTDLCARPGDSGGPLFSQIDHTAYGILEGNQQSRKGSCYAGELNNYSPLSKIYEQMDLWRDNGYTGGATFRVITSSGG
ncbi:MAG: trypsin-like serine protease [Hamadaea sp.]|uniref:trypsin-like serine protease n=1 Tax=Hamadaea sp. TaxID=2024425 RepID=UPI0017ED184D|nr:trypsin-like serine protease [Hamadaea sp.]NUT20806.1 trypsin-like serine protease [Hamadaea sp.]